MPVWKLEMGVWTLKEQSTQCGLESPLACRWWKSAWVSYVTWHSASVLSEDFTENPGNPGNAFSFSSGSEGMGLNPEEESMVAGESHRADNLCSMGWLPLLASCISLFLFGSSPPSLSWHIKSLKLKKLPFLDGSFSVCVLGVGRGDWLGLNLVFWTSLEYQVINYLTVLKFGVVPFMWYLVDECSVKVSHWLPYLCVVFDKGLKVFRCGQDSGTLLHCPLLGTRGTCGSEYCFLSNHPSILWWTWQKERINGMVSLVAQSVKNLPAVHGDRLQCSTPAFEKIPGEGNGNPLQFSCLGNPIDRSLAGSSPRGLKSQTRLSD